MISSGPGAMVMFSVAIPTGNDPLASLSLDSRHDFTPSNLLVDSNIHWHHGGMCHRQVGQKPGIPWTAMHSAST
jgi:hypothetical protein